MRERGCHNPKVMSADDLTAYGESGPNIGMNARNRIRDRNRLQVGEQVLDKRTAARALRPPGAMDTVEQLTDGDDADRPVLVSDRLVDRWIGDTALEVDEHVGVD